MRKELYILILTLLVLTPGSYAQENDIYRIERLNINTGNYNEMVPVLTKDGIAFCSDRKPSAIKDIRTHNRSLIYNIYFAPKKDSIEWGKARILDDKLSPLVHEGPFCFSPDGNQIYFTSNVEQGKKALKKGINNNRGIFIAHKDGDSWTNIEPFEHNDPLWNVAHPFISSDGKYLFFSSDIPGGEGGSDIWYCEKIRGKWSIAINLGPEVNSPAAELYPYFSPNQELYFASDRDGGFGGLDLYSSALRYGQWEEPSIMPEPINSESDDFAYILEAGSSDGYFTSNRRRSDDIYKFTSLIIRKNNCDTLVIDDFCYEFTEPNAIKFDSLPYEYEWDFDDGSFAKGAVAVHCFKGPGKYLVKLNVIDLVSGVIKKNEVNHLVEITRTEQAYIESPDTCTVGEMISFDGQMTNLPGWDISKYYWNFDDGTIGKGAQTSKTFTETGIYLVQLIVSSEPDENGVVRESCVSKIIVVEEKQ